MSAQLMVVIYAFRENIFVVKFKWRVNSTKWHFWTVGCGTEEELQKFHYKIRFFNDEEEIQYKGPVITIDKPPANILKQQVGLVMTDAAIRQSSGFLKLSVDHVC